MKSSTKSVIVIGTIVILVFFLGTTLVWVMTVSSIEKPTTGTIVAIDNTWQSDGTTYTNATVVYNLHAARPVSTTFIYTCTYYHVGLQIPIYYYMGGTVWGFWHFSPSIAVNTDAVPQGC